MKQSIKKLSKSTPAQWLIASLVALYIAALRLTCKKVFINRSSIENAYNNNENVIVTLWHGRLLCMPALFPKGKKVNALISDHSDGRIISKTAAWFGINTVSGSSSKGGAKALRNMVKASKSGETIFITPDGPKGPAMHFQQGAMEVARMTGAKIIPVSISCTKGKLAKSWDRFMLPRPFSTLTFVYGEPLAIEKDASKDARAAFALNCEQAMNSLQQQADKNAPFSTNKEEL